MVHVVYAPMKYKLIAGCVWCMVTFTAFSQTVNNMKTTNKNLACKLTTPALQQRKATVIAALKQQVRKRQPLDDGYSFTFKPTDEILDQLNDFIKTERLCCDFLTFRMTVHQDTINLDITGPEGAKEFLVEEIGF